MATLKQVQKGLTQFIDTEIAGNLQGWEKVGFCSASALIIKNLPVTFDKYKDNQFIQMLGVIDDKGNIDIDALRDTVTAYITEEHIDIPIIKMRLKVTPEDVDKLYTMIKEA